MKKESLLLLSLVILGSFSILGCPPPGESPIGDGTPIGGDNGSNNDNVTLDVSSSKPEGTYFSNVAAQLVATKSDAKIYYTLDDTKTLEAKDEFLYSKGLELSITQNKTLRFFAIQGDIKTPIKAISFVVTQGVAGIAFKYDRKFSDKKITYEIQKDDFIREIRFTLNKPSSMPTLSDEQYFGLRSLDAADQEQKTELIRARGFDKNGIGGPVIEETFIVDKKNPGVDYEVLNVANDGQVTIQISSANSSNEIFVLENDQRIKITTSPAQHSFMPSASKTIKLLAKNPLSGRETDPPMTVNTREPVFTVDPLGTEAAPLKFVPSQSNRELSIAVSHDPNVSVHYTIQRDDEVAQQIVAPSKQSPKVQDHWIHVDPPKMQKDPIVVFVHMKAFDLKKFPSATKSFKYLIDGKPSVLSMHSDGGSLCWSGMNVSLNAHSGTRTRHPACGKAQVPVYIVADEDSTFFYTEDS